MKSRNSLGDGVSCVRPGPCQWQPQKRQTALSCHAACSRGFARSGRVRSAVSSKLAPVQVPGSMVSHRRTGQSRSSAAPDRGRSHRQPWPKNPGRCCRTSFCVRPDRSSACAMSARHTAHRRRPKPARSVVRSSGQNPWAGAGRESCECAGPVASS